jgi:hypothetical protein
MRLDFTFRFDDITVKGDLGAVRQQARRRSRSALPARRNQRVSGSCSFWNAGGHWKITQHMYQQLPEQSEGAAPASSESATRIRARSAPLAVAEQDAAPAVTLIYLPVQGPCR